jgi:hypothetical protein
MEKTSMVNPHTSKPTEYLPAVQQEMNVCKSVLWKLKEELDESFEE